MTFADEIEEAARGEPIEAIVVASVGTSYRPADDRFEQADALAGQVVSWEKMRPLLAYEYDSGYGSADCHAITAWTASRVIFVGEYDGATGMNWLPRNPVVHCPEMSGCTDAYQYIFAKEPER